LHNYNQAATKEGSDTVCRKSGTPARQKTAKSGHPTFRNFKLHHDPKELAYREDGKMLAGPNWYSSTDTPLADTAVKEGHHMVRFTDSD